MNSSRSTLHPRDEIMQTMDRIYRYRMTTTSGGNLSIRDEAGDIWISPARVDKGNLTRGDIVCVHPDGTVDGLHPPSSEFPFHKAIYDTRPDIRAIVHAHPVALVAFSICRKSPNTRLFHQAHIGLWKDRIRAVRVSRVAKHWAKHCGHVFAGMRQRHSGEPWCRCRWKRFCQVRLNGLRRLSSQAKR